MRQFFISLSAALMLATPAVAEPYTFTPDDYIEYGIFFAPRGRNQSWKLLDLRFGNIRGWYGEYFPAITDIPSQKQSLRLVTPRGSVRVNRNDSEGLSVTRDTYTRDRRSGRGPMVILGTRRLEVNFQNGTCKDAEGSTSACSVNLVLTTDGPDRGVKREARTLSITTSTGLQFRYRSIRSDGGKPLNRAALRRSSVITNYAWQWIPEKD
jgi:hypothetical protein